VQSFAFVSQPFDLLTEIPIRAVVYQTGDKKWRLVFVIHHIAVDGRSVDLLHRELAQCYEAFGADASFSLPALKHQYANFSAWQHERHTLVSFAADRSYWREKLSGDLATLNLPNDAPLAPTSQGSVVTLRINDQLLRATRDFATFHQSTLFITLLAAIKATLYRYTKQDDIVIGTTVSTRDQAETENLIGYCINVLPLRTQVSGSDSFADLLKLIRETTLGALSHKDFPFEILKKEVLSTQATGQDMCIRIRRR
jgi:NRPS condensation-like uncharacterized protein